MLRLLIKHTGLICCENRNKSSGVKRKQLPLEALTLSALTACIFLYFCPPPAGPQDLGIGWVGEAALGFVLFLSYLWVRFAFTELSVPWGTSLCARVKTGFERRFLVFHTSVLIFTGKEHKSFYILYLCCLCTVLHSIDSIFGLTQFPCGLTQRWLYLRVGEVYWYLNDENTGLFRGYKIGTATGKPQGLLLSNCTVEARLLFFGAHFRSLRVHFHSRAAERCFLGVPRTSTNITLCLILTRMLMLRP